MAADFTPAEEVQSILVVPWEMAEKVVRDFFREEWVEEPRKTMLTEVLVVEVVLMDGEQAVEGEEEGTLVEAVVNTVLKPVGEGEGLTMQDQISKANVATTQLVMVR